MKHATRKRIAAALCLMVLSPLLPFAILSVTAEAIHDFLEWAFNGRWLARQMKLACDRIETYFGVDADTEYQEWKDRQRGRILATKGGN